MRGLRATAVAVSTSSVVPSLTASSVLRLWRDQCVFHTTEQIFMKNTTTI